MAIREILIVPDPRLKKVSAPVEGVDDALRALMDDMLETMYAAPASVWPPSRSASRSG